MDYPEGAMPLGDLHKQLSGKVWKWVGSFGRTEKNIGVDPIQFAIQLRQLLDDARFWVESDTYPPTELAARFHHKLEQMNERRDQYIAALRAADGHEYADLLDFVGA